MSLPWEQPIEKQPHDCKHERIRTTVLDGSSPHYAENRCADCGAFVGFAPKPGNKKRRSDNDAHWKQMHVERGEIVCKICGIRESEIPIVYHVHHWEPLSEGGKDEFENTSMLCQFCHESLHIQRRRMRHFMDYMREVINER